MTNEFKRALQRLHDLEMSLKGDETDDDERADVLEEIEEIEKTLPYLASISELTGALELCHRLFTEALPKFDWGASFLDANAIQLLNEVPGEVAHVLGK